MQPVLEILNRYKGLELKQDNMYRLNPPVHSGYDLTVKYPVTNPMSGAEVYNDLDRLRQSKAYQEKPIYLHDPYIEHGK